MPTFTRERESAGRIIMENQREIYEALLAGETLIHAEHGHTVAMSEIGFLSSSNWTFDTVSDWQIYIKPEWYDNIPEGGVLCISNDGKLVPIAYYEKPYLYKNHNNTFDTNFVTPVVKSKIQVYLDNAPKD